MIAVLYRWKIRPGKEAEFVDAWAKATRRTQHFCGSYGSRLHQSQDGIYWAYARWPSLQARAECPAKLMKEDFSSFQAMQACIEEQYEETVLALKEDLLVEPPRGGA